MPIEDIAHLVGHANTRVTEFVYRKRLRPRRCMRCTVHASREPPILPLALDPQGESSAGIVSPDPLRLIDCRGSDVRVGRIS